MDVGVEIMVLRKLLRGAFWLLMVGTSLAATTEFVPAGEPAEGGNPQGVVRLSDQIPRGGIQQISYAEAISCGQTAATGCANGACPAGACTAGSCGKGACAAGSCANGACGPRGYIVRPNGAGNGAANGSYDPNDPCRGRRLYGHGNRWNREVETYTFRDLGHDTFGWAMPNKGNGNGNGNAGQNQCPHCRARGSKCDRCCRSQGWLDQQADMFYARNRQQSDIMGAHIRGKLAFLTPMGNGGAGAPPFGCYQLVYPVAPDYAHPNDMQQQYGAQGYGVPMSVPLAPNVRHTMNYSAGMPASRLTPISNVVPPQRCP